MSDHRQPTPEELELENKKILEDLEKTPESTSEDEDNGETEEIKETTPEVKEEIQEEKTDEDLEEEDVEDETKEEEVKEEKKLPPPEELLKESTKEAQRLFDKNRRLNEAINKASELTDGDITEDDIKSEYPEWEEMTETEKKLAKSTLLNNKRFLIVDEANKEIKNHELWVKEVSKFTDDPKLLVDNQFLEGKLDEFKAFAVSPEYRNYNLEDVVLIYKGRLDNAKKIASKGKMFETGGNASKEKPSPNDDKISVAESRVLMEKDYKTYMQFLKQGKIASE